MLIYYPSNIFIYNKYLRWYRAICEGANERNKHLMEYTENHHILPSCMFPAFENLKKNPWNCAKLTFREHFLAHWLLSKCAIHEKHQALMLCAINGMRRKSSSQNRIVASWQYEIAKRSNRDGVALLMQDPDHKKKMIESNIRGAETRRQLWKDPEFREMMLESNREAQSRPEVRLKKSNTLKERNKNPEHRKKLSDAQNRFEVRRKKSEAAKARWSETEHGEKMLTIRKEAANRPGARRANSERQKIAQNRLEVKENNSRRAKERLNDPAWIAKYTNYCECCDKIIIGPGPWTCHLRSKKHMNKLKEKEGD